MTTERLTSAIWCAAICLCFYFVAVEAIMLWSHLLFAIV